MPLFVCSKCKTIENTALCRYWFRENKEKPLCSDCDPKMRSWHNRFSKEKFDPKKWVKNRGDFIIPKEEYEKSNKN